MDKRSLEKLDRRGVEFKRYEEVRAALVSDLGGDDAVSTAQMQIADKCAFIAMQLERQQIASLAGEDIDMRAYGELVDRLRRNLETLGLERKLKDITSLSDTPLEYMLNTLRDETENTSERMKAAINAAPYVHPKLQNIAHIGDKDNPVAVDMNMTDAARRIAFVLEQGLRRKREKT